MHTHLRRSLPILVVLGLCVQPLAADDEKDPATGKTKAKVRVDKPLRKTRAQLHRSGLAVERTVYVKVPEQRVKVINGKEVTVTVFKTVPKVVSVLFAKGTFRVFNSGGEAIQGDDLAKLLKKKRQVYVAEGKLPDTKQLQRLGKDAVIVVQEVKPKAAKKA